MTQKKEQVYLRQPHQDDRGAILDAYARSSVLHEKWSIPPADIAFYLAQPHRFFVCSTTSDAIVGTFNISEIVRGRLQSAFIGYEVFAPYQRKGLMFDGMRLVLRKAFGVMNLHRLEANIQPENYASKALARKAGFVKEGYSKDYLYFGGRWCDHERWAITNPNWIAQKNKGNKGYK